MNVLASIEPSRRVPLVAAELVPALFCVVMPPPWNRESRVQPFVPVAPAGAKPKDEGAGACQARNLGQLLQFPNRTDLMSALLRAPMYMASSSMDETSADIIESPAEAKVSHKRACSVNPVVCHLSPAGVAGFWVLISDGG